MTLLVGASVVNVDRGIFKGCVGYLSGRLVVTSVLYRSRKGIYIARLCRKSFIPTNISQFSETM
jgi:hypothetical protein